MPTETPLTAAKQHGIPSHGIAYPPGATTGTAMLADSARSTLAASEDIARKDWEMVNIIRRLELDKLLREELAYMQQETVGVLEQRKKQLRFELHSAFDGIPLESFVEHPADEILTKALQAAVNSPAIFQFIQEFCLDFSRPDFAASTLRCLSRQPAPKDSEWRTQLVRASLASESLNVRDAAIQAADAWRDADMATILQSHQESEPWLREYISEIIADLER